MSFNTVVNTTGWTMLLCCLVGSIISGGEFPNGWVICPNMALYSLYSFWGMARCE